MATEYDSPRDRASAALAEFRRRLPLMTGFARSFSGNKRVRIVASGKGSFTDGDTVHLEVPLTLADKVPHNASRCDQWDSRGFQMCPACAVRDDLNYQLFHEISHIWGGSFEGASKWELHGAVEVVKQYHPKMKHPEVLLEMEGDSWLAVAYRVHPFIKELQNCFEDARVNGLMAKARPGVRQWRRAFEMRLMEEGVRRFDPRTNTETRFHPGEASLNAQMAYALYFMAAEGKIPPFADKYVAKQLADPRVEQLITEALDNERAEKTFEFAVRAYALMADMGFFGNEDKLQMEQEQDDQGAPDAGDSEDQSGEPEDSGGSEGDMPQEDEGASAESYSAPQDDAAGSGDDASDDRDEASPDGDLDSGEGSQDGGDAESSDGPGDESDDDGEASDGVAEEAADYEDPGEAESAHEGEDDPGAGGESEADEVGPDEGDESADGSNPGDSGEGAPEDSDGNSSEGDAASEGGEADASEGEGSLAEGGDPSNEDQDDAGGSGEVSDADGDADSEGDSGAEPSGDGLRSEDADEEAGSEGDGSGAGDEQGEAHEDEPSDPRGDDDASGDSGGDHEERSDDPGVGEDGSCKSSTEDEADATEGGTQGGDEGSPAEADDSDGEEGGEAQDNLGTGQPGDSTEGESGSGQDGEGGGAGDSESDGDDLEAADRDEVDDDEAVDRPDAGVDDDFAGETSGESDGNAGTHGSSGGATGMDGQGNSDLSDGSEDIDPDPSEEADVAPMEPQDDGPPEDREWGDVEEVHERLEELFGHHSPNEAELEEVVEELERLVHLGDVFDEVPRNVTQVWWNRWGKHYHSETWGDAATSWTHKIHFGYWFHSWSPTEIGIEGDFRVSDAVIGKALLKARVAFSDNARKKEVRNLKYGRVNARVLGRRAPVHDARLFKKVARPGKRDYFVVIGLDLSASTASFKTGKDPMGKERPLNALALIKRSAMAQAEILSRLGVKFAIYGHSCKLASASLEMSDWAVNMYVVKEAHEPWNEATKRRLESLGPDEGNLDGHTLQLYRKIAEKETATDKIVMYYTDGQIPAANGEEEGHILVKQIERCRKEGIALMGVGVGTDSLKEFGFDYTRVDSDDDIVRVVNNLERRLAE